MMPSQPYRHYFHLLRVTTHSGETFSQPVHPADVDHARHGVLTHGLELPLPAMPGRGQGSYYRIEPDEIARVEIVGPSEKAEGEADGE